MKADPVRLIETAYDDAVSEEAWLDAVTRAAAPLLDDGLGLFTSIYALSADKERPTLGAIVQCGGLEGASSRQHAIIDGSPPAMLSEAFGKNRIATLTEFFGKPIGPEVPALGDQLFPIGARDSMGLLSIDPDGTGVVISVPLRSPRVLTPAFRQRWSRLMAHVGAGLRLRRGTERNDADSDAEAVLDASGRVHHAKAAARTTEARAALRYAARAIDRARAKRKISPDDAVGAWRALTEGQWSLVDRFESDGRHFLVARRNVPHRGARARLTERESCVVALAALGRTNKHIAYELGISVGTVSTFLTRAARKLGVRSRTQLITAWTAIRES
jgi:DNA-binding CsgD family transcriptional regulator